MTAGSSESGVGRSASSLPRHVAIIMDGNGRWAQQRGLPRTAGHKAGVKSVRAVVEESARKHLEVLTLFAFSSENWQRPREEVGRLMELFILALRQEAKRLLKNNVRLRVIGDVTAFPEKLQKSIAAVESDTAGNNGLVLQVAANYGGRWDITQALRRLGERVQQGSLDPSRITEEAIAKELSFPGLPDPDLFIRTGGEQRLSNFLLWQSAYAELYFTDCLWPDFGVDALQEALSEFGRRQRRFGLTTEQVTEENS
jgi:undecaprenyl diphosphate synthase